MSELNIRENTENIVLIFYNVTKRNNQLQIIRMQNKEYDGTC